MDAHDRVFVGQYGFLRTTEASEKGEILKTLIIENKKVNALQVASLLVAISTAEPKYNTFQGQCYWAASRIAEVLERIGGGKWEEGPQADKAARHLVYRPNGGATLSDVEEKYGKEWEIRKVSDCYWLGCAC